jgi:hypothetical protein
MGPARSSSLASLAGTSRPVHVQLNYAKAVDKPVVLLPGFGRELRFEGCERAGR